MVSLRAYNHLLGGHYLTISLDMYSLRKICQNAGFLLPGYLRIFSDLRFFPYTGMYRSEKTCILRYLTQRFQNIKYCNLTFFHGASISWKSTVSTEFRAICWKLCRNCAFPQNLHTRKLGEISVFYSLLFYSAKK